jgi:hypothetical protein
MSNSISPKTNKIINVFFSLGAAVVIIATLAKILHLSWADYALILGFITEAVIFTIYAFLPPPEVGDSTHAPQAGVVDSVMAHLEAAKLDGAAFEKLSTSFQRLNDTAKHLGDLADMSKASKDLNEQIATMSKSIEAMNTYYAKLAEASNAMSSSAQDAIRAKEQIALLADNLTQLNKVYGNMISSMQGR